MLDAEVAMFVITADQIDSRSTASRGAEAVELIERLGGGRLALPADRTSGDEVQALTADARTALEITLALVRDGHWRVGLGIGAVDTPLSDTTRTATGAAFVAARDAIDVAKKRPLGAAIEIAGAPTSEARPLSPSAETLQAMLDLLLTVRMRRSPEGWEVTDLVDAGLSQGEAAARLGITPQAASKRAIAAATRVDAAARAGLAELLATADASVRADS
ncbi:DNA-binding protein [Salinibacterium sp. ZJ70]|uniref:DNA-binding protein n=1 Tax=Salinibacterium sp. ZJ70 TaxID=2708084 RepID=UPI001CD5E860|nr:DNA-binding protein [Salinibacterium sp. ZJ70]